MENTINISLDKVSETLLYYYQNYYKETTGDKVSVKSADARTFWFTPVYAEGFGGTEMDELDFEVKLDLEIKSELFDEPVKNEITVKKEEAFEVLKDIYNEELDKVGLEVTKIGFEKTHLEVSTREKSKKISV